MQFQYIMRVQLVYTKFKQFYTGLFSVNKFNMREYEYIGNIAIAMMYQVCENIFGNIGLIL